MALPLITAGLSAAGSAAGGIFGRTKETKTDKRKRELIDDLLASVKGNGPYSDMFNTSEAAFQKSYVDPAKAMFKNQIASQIQQSYIATGQQRGTGLDDTLARAGVDLDQMLNSQYLNYQNQANANKINVFNSALGMGQGTQNQSIGSGAAQGVAGYTSGDQFGNQIADILKAFQKQPNTTANKPQYGPTGFEVQ